MKVHINPQKSVVTGIIQEKINSEQRLLDEDNTELAKITGGEYKVIRPGQKEAAGHLVRQRTEYIRQLTSQLDLLNNHPGESIPTEIEL